MAEGGGDEDIKNCYRTTIKFLFPQSNECNQRKLTRGDAS